MKSLRDPCKSCKGFIPQITNWYKKRRNGLLDTCIFSPSKSGIISGLYTLNFRGGYTFWKRNVAVFLMFLVVGGWKKSSQCLFAFFIEQKPRKPGVSLKEKKSGTSWKQIAQILAFSHSDVRKPFGCSIPLPETNTEFTWPKPERKWSPSNPAFFRCELLVSGRVQGGPLPVINGVITSING